MEIYSLTILEVKISEGIHSSALPFGAQGRRLLLTSSSFCWPQAFLGLCIPSMYAYLWLQMAFFFFLNDLFFVCVHFCQRNFTGLRGHYNSMEKAMAPHSSTLAWNIPWTEEPSELQSMGSLELDMTEQLHFDFSLSCIGEGNGNPLQCSCLENPKDGGAWWAAICGVAQS